MKLIVGLGNPGKNYENTRHNIGFMVIDNYIKFLDQPINWQNKFQALYTCVTINNEKIYFLKPQTYMNLSGNSVLEIIKYFKIPIKDILIIHDDLDLDLGKYRIKFNSSHGGHNGIKSVIENLNTQEFAQLKIGISNNKDIPTSDYVLAKFGKKELSTLNELMPIFNNIIQDFIKYDITKLMNTYNRNK